MGAMIESMTGLFASACGITVCDKNVAGYAIPDHVHGLQHRSQPARLPSRDPRSMCNNPRVSVVDVRPVSDCRISERSTSDWQAVLFTTPQMLFTTPKAWWLLKRPTGARFAQSKARSMLRLNHTSPTERVVCVGSRFLVGSKAIRRMIPAAAYRGKALAIAGRVAV